MIKQWWAARRAARHERLRAKLRIELAGLAAEMGRIHEISRVNDGVFSALVYRGLEMERRVGEIRQHLKEIE